MPFPAWLEHSNFEGLATLEGWQIATEATSDPATANLSTLGQYAIYMKNNKFVIAYNNGGTMTYISIPMDGSSTGWTHSTSAP